MAFPRGYGLVDWCGGVVGVVWIGMGLLGLLLAVLRRCLQSDSTSINLTHFVCMCECERA